MEIVHYILSGLTGAALTAGMSYYIYTKSKKTPSGKSYEILKGLGKILEEPQGEYYYTRSSNDNYFVANHIYSHADGEIIATAFNEDPSTYGERDLVRMFKYGGSLFTRITCEEVCSGESIEIAEKSLYAILKGSSFVVVPRGELLTRIDGIFCRFNDNTYLAFVAFRDAQDPSKNKGVIFRDGIANYYFEYFHAVKGKYERS
jgi:hypothetical protein